MPLPEATTNERGFEIIRFDDRYGKQCSAQISSLATEYALWIGIDDAEPKVMARDAAKVGVKTDAVVGWVDYPIPPEVLLHTRMHLSKPLVEGLVEILQRWLRTKSLKAEEVLSKTCKQEGLL